jgi:hypothetical protein
MVTTPRQETVTHLMRPASQPSPCAFLTQEKTAALIDASHKCVDKALKSKFEISDALTPKAKIECQAFARDGGAASVSIWLRMPDDEETPDDEATPPSLR